MFAIIKGNPGPAPAPVYPGAIVGWPISDGRVSEQSVTNKISDIFLDFGATWLDDTRLFISDPAFGVSILHVGEDLKITEQAHTVIAAQSAICWTAYDPNLNTAYAPDASRTKIFTIDPGSGALTGTINVDSNLGGVLDSAISNSRMYSLVDVNGVTVTDLEQRKTVQFLNLTSFGNRAEYTGMALWP